VVEITRGDEVESSHRGYACVVDSDGKIIYAIGDSAHRTLLRSSAKPLQALAAVVSGATERFGIAQSELAVIAGSHGGEDRHIAAVASVLNKAALPPDSLQCGIHPPLDVESGEGLRRQGIPPSALHHNCSGKHCGMLISALALKASTEDYLDPAHPVQQLILELMAEFAGIGVADISLGMDGCSAPAHSMPMRSAALAFARLVEPDGLRSASARAAAEVYRAMLAHPEMVAASRNRICTALIRAGAAVGLTAKSGAEGYYAAGWRDPATGRGRGLTVKIEDGAQRARDPLVIAILGRFGVLPASLPPELKVFAASPILNHRRAPVGEARVCLEAGA
jgi:L-asparaginase II